ncbi:MAG: NTP transferase domain-containing protein, partial [Bacteroidales bacterium]|nr:NTP transferase domain-containing protein [Bacteroidales bacterium]
MKALIFAAGLGTRLRPLTDDRPKALVEAGGMTLLERTVKTLRNAGFDHIAVNVHHFGEQVMAFAESRGLNLAISDERDLLRDTGGGVKHAFSVLYPERETTEPFLIHNVDIVSNLDLRRFWDCHRPSDLATLLVSGRRSSRYLLFDDDMCLRGWMNEKTGEVRSPYPEFDPASCRKYAFAGIHILSPEVFGLMKNYPETFSIIDF